MISKRKSFLPIAIITIAISSVYALSLKVLAEDDTIFDQVKNLQVIERGILLPIASLPSPQVSKTIKVMVTAYSSTVEQTDDTPFITASNKTVREGIIANNLLPFGTKVRIPELFGDKIFEVDDRMNSRKGDYHVDIWFASKEQAVDFGAKIAVLEILEN